VDNTNQCFDCANGKFEEGTKINLYWNCGARSQRFNRNKDGTISPMAGRAFILGLNDKNRLILVEKKDTNSLVFYDE
jgi:hypothetical protein